LGTRLIFSKGEAILMAVLNKEHLESLRKQLNFLQDRDEFTLIP
jgi:hypothetical protein